MPRRCGALVMRTRPEVPSSGMVFRRKSGKTKAFCATARCDIPACLRIPYRPTVTARPLPSPRPFFSRSPNQPIGFLPLCGNAPVPPFAHEGCRRRPQAPAQKKRNFLDLWQTIAQDLSRLFAVPGGCPSCPGSRKDWPEPFPASAAPCPLRVCCPQPSGKRFALSGRNTMHTHADTDMATRQGRTPFHRAPLPQHRGTGAGWLPGALRYSRMDLNKKFWQG